MTKSILLILIALGAIAAVVVMIIFNNKFVVIGSRVYDAAYLEDNGLIPAELVTINNINP